MIFLVVAGVAGCVILGSIVLALFPIFRLTILNVFVFVIGAIVGIFALANLVERPLMNVGLYSKMTMPVKTN